MNNKKITTYLIQAFLFTLFLNPYSSLAQDTQSKQTKISKINFEGNEYFTSAQLENMIALKAGSSFTNEQFEEDIKNIISNYQKEGYLECSVEKIGKEFNFDSSAVIIDVSIKENRQTTIGEINIEGNKYYTTKFLSGIMFTKVGKVLDEGTLNQDITQILNNYEKNGFAFASIFIKEIIPYDDNGKQKLRVSIKIEENDRVQIDRVVIEGNTTTKDNVVLREIRLNKNSITRDDILDIRKRLENLGYFGSVEDPKIYKYKNSTILKIVVTEGNTNTFDGIIGYVPPNATVQKGYFTGLINLSLKNLFGTGRRLDARWQKDVQSTQELALKYLEPWVLGYPVNANFAFQQRIQDSTYIKRNFNFKADAMISKNLTASVSGDIERVIPTFTSQNFFQNGLYTVFDSRTLSTGAEIKLDTRDYVYNPLRGVLFRADYSVGQKRIYNAGAFQGYDIQPNFTVQKTTLGFDFYYSFFRRQSSLISINGGEVITPRFENADYLRIGGNSTVRGYREEQFLASKAAWANIEMRYSLTRKTFASVFYDFGYYFRPYDAIALTSEEKNFIFGYGVGIRIETGLGIFGVSYALGHGDSFLEGKIHFGLINDF